MNLPECNVHVQTVTYCTIGLKSRGTCIILRASFQVPTPFQPPKEWMKVDERKNNQNWQKANKGKNK
jgi:hypothetical protein